MPNVAVPTADALRKRRMRNLAALVTLAAIVLLLLGAEAAVRVRAKIKYGTSTRIEDLYRVDPKLDLRVARPNMTVGRISVNSAGFRGPEIAMPKPPGTLRIAYLGASAVWCGEASGNEYVWPHLATVNLRRAFPDATIDYVNAGLPGYMMEAIDRNFVYRVAPLQPDVVVIYEAANNLSDELRELAASRGLIDEAQMHETSWPGNYSMLWYLVEKNLAVLSAKRRAQSNQGRLDVDASKLGEQYRKSLEQTVRDAQQRVKLVAIAPYSTQLRREQSPEEQMRAATSAFFYMPFATTALLIAGYDRYNAIAREVARESGALLIDGERDIPADPRHFTDTVHFTDTGSRVQAERISKALAADPRFIELVRASMSEHAK